MLFEILPNWHPFFVHYTISFFSIGALIYSCVTLLSFKETYRDYLYQASIFCLRVGAIFTILTVASGFHAYLTVPHAETAHAPMVDHRNWALVTVLIGLLLGGLSFLHKKQTYAPKLLLLLAIPLFFMVLITGYKGADLVFRYGVGVLPQNSEPAKADGHDLNHHH